MFAQRWFMRTVTKDRIMYPLPTMLWQPNLGGLEVLLKASFLTAAHFKKGTDAHMTKSGINLVQMI